MDWIDRLKISTYTRMWWRRPCRLTSGRKLGISQGEHSCECRSSSPREGSQWIEQEDLQRWSIGRARSPGFFFLSTGEGDASTNRSEHFFSNRTGSGKCLQLVDGIPGEQSEQQKWKRKKVSLDEREEWSRRKELSVDWSIEWADQLVDQTEHHESSLKRKRVSQRCSERNSRDQMRCICRSPLIIYKDFTGRVSAARTLRWPKASFQSNRKEDWDHRRRDIHRSSVECDRREGGSNGSTSEEY